MSQPSEKEQGVILVCDDEAHIRHIVVAKLRGCGFSVVEARDGAQGLEMMRAHKPRLVITDFQMPGSTGLDLAKAAKGDAELAGTPLVMLSARGYVLPPEELQQTNIVAIIAKPFGVRDLMDRVQQLLAPKGGADALAA